jgi:molecular chaperone GrpE
VPHVPGPVADRLAELEEWKARALRLEADLERERERVSTLEGEVEAWRARASELEAGTDEWREGESRLEAEVEEWRDRALRLQADMENYRRRQQRLAQDATGTERERLLNAFLGVVDDLERALAAPVSGEEGVGAAESVRRGVELTHRAAVQLLEKEGVEPVEAEQQPFDPNWHEAVATVGRNGHELEPDTVIQVVEPGYRLGDRLLRPAKVVVAV